MGNPRRLTLVCGLLLFNTSGALARGMAGADFLEIKTSARGAGLGEAFVALADDASCLEWNPAGIAFQSQPAFELDHIDYFADTRLEYLAGVWPGLLRGGFGLGLYYSTVDDLVETDSFGNSRPIRAADFVGTVAYARAWGRILSTGISVKTYASELAGSKAFGYALDLGLIARPWAWSSLGLSLLNLGPDIVYDVLGDPLPAWLKIGVSGSPLKARSHRITLGLEQNLPVGHEARPYLNAGLEYWILGLASLRAGYSGGSEGGRLSYGAGLKYRFLALNYAFVPFAVVGDTHHLSLQLLLEPAVSKAPVTEAAALPPSPEAAPGPGPNPTMEPDSSAGDMEAGQRAMSSQNYSSAVESYRRATNLSPASAPAWKGLGTALAYLSDWDGARAAFRKALELDPADSSVAEWLKQAGEPGSK